MEWHNNYRRNNIRRNKIQKCPYSSTSISSSCPGLIQYSDNTKVALLVSSNRRSLRSVLLGTVSKPRLQYKPANTLIVPMSDGVQWRAGPSSHLTFEAGLQRHHHVHLELFPLLVRSHYSVVQGFADLTHKGVHCKKTRTFSSQGSPNYDPRAPPIWPTIVYFDSIGKCIA